MSLEGMAKEIESEFGFMRLSRVHKACDVPSRGRKAVEGATGRVVSGRRPVNGDGARKNAALPWGRGLGRSPHGASLTPAFA